MKITKKELFYDEISDIWSSKINNSETKKRLRIIFKELLNRKKLDKKKFLEIGCGLGYFSHKAFKLGAKVTGIDVGPNLIKMNIKMTPKGKFLVASASNLPFKDEEFDVTLSTEVIEHVENQPKSIKEMFRVTKTKGVVVITTPNKIYKPLFDLLSLLRIRPYHGNEKWYYPWQLKKIIEKHGDIKIERYFNFFIPNTFFDFFEQFKLIKYLMINQGYMVIKK